MAEGTDELAHEGIVVACSIHPVSGWTAIRPSDMVLQISNTTNTTIKLKKGRHIANLEQVAVGDTPDPIRSITAGEHLRAEQQERESSMDKYEELASAIQDRINEDSSISAIQTPTQRKLVLDALLSYTHLFDDRNLGAARNGKDIVEHQINTGSHPPIYQHARRQPPALEAAIDAEIAAGKAAGIIQDSCSPWASPIVMVRKPNGKWRMCIDYRRLNAITVADVYPLPPIDQMLYNMGNSKVFSAMDLQSAYHQIVVAEQDREKTAFIHRSGLYEYVRMPFGLRNAPATFQRFMNMMLASSEPGIRRCVMAYLDDVIVFSNSIEEHAEHLSSVLAMLSRHGLKLQLSKCTFAVTRTKYLGHVLDGEGVHVDPSYVKGVTDMPLPSSVKELQSFLGLTGYYRRFINSYSEIALPLYSLLRKDVKWEWTEQHTQAVNTLKRALTSAPVLVMPDYTKRFIVQTDASYAGVGAVLAQTHTIDGKEVERPIAFVSRSLKPAEKNYSVTHLELLGVMFAVKQFRHYILGSNFLIQTDHRALNGLMTSTDLSGRLQRWLTALQEYLPFEITYRKGKVNANADALSRLPVPQPDVVRLVADESGNVKLAEIGYKQQGDPDWQHIYKFKAQGVPPAHLSGKDLIKFERDCEQYIVTDGVLSRVYHLNGKSQLDNTVLQLCVTKSMVPSILKEMHDDLGGHLSAGKTYGKLQQRYYWKNMAKDTIDYCRSCEVCARRKDPHRRPGVPLLSPQLDHLTNYGPMQCIALDTIGPMTTSAGNCIILTIVDYYTRQGAAIPLRRQTTANLVTSVHEKWFNVHGFPKLIVCDNGPGFKSKTMQEALKLLGVQIHYVSPYHPQSNGVCERLNGTLINMLASYTNNDNQNRWTQFIQMVVFAYNTSIHSATGFTPYFLTHGREASIGSDAALSLNADVRALPDYVRDMQRDLAFAHQNILDRVQQAAGDREKLNDELKSLAEFQPGDQVYVYAPPKSADGNSRKLMSPYHGPYTVIGQTGRVTYTLRNNHTNKKTSAHVTLMKRAIERPAHLVPASASGPAAPAVALAATDVQSSVVEPASHGVSRHTRTQRATRLQQQAQDAAASVPQTPVSDPNDMKYPVSKPPTLSPIDPKPDVDPDTDGEDSDDDSSPPDEPMELEEGEVPPSLVNPLSA